MAPYQYPCMENTIQKIIAGGVTLSEEEMKKYNIILGKIFEIMELNMKIDPTFAVLFRQRQYVGSYYENLKIDVPDEFDIDFELEIPAFIGIVESCRSKEPGYCRLKLDKNISKPSDLRKEAAQRKVNEWTDDEGFILRSEVNRWMQGVVDKAVDIYRTEQTEKPFQFERSRSHSGPAETLIVTLIEDPNLRLSLDFVPVFVFEKWPGPETVKNLHEWMPEMEEKRWYAVPKSKDDYRDFRLSFYHQEKNLLNDTNQMKPVLKLIKKLRDNKKWYEISSYYIKTVFLWKTAAEGKQYWCKGLAETFIEMLEELQNILLEKKALPFFWVKENDLLSALHSETKINVGGFLQHMVRDIKRNHEEPDYLLRYFPLNDRSTLLQSQHEDNTATIAAVAVGAAALLAVGLYNVFRDKTRSQE